MRQTRRLLESDLQLPQNALDAEPHKSLIKNQVDEARPLCGVCACTPTALTLRAAGSKIMRLLVVLETEADGRAAAPHATKPANLKRARDEPVKARCSVAGNRERRRGASTRANAPLSHSLELTSLRSWEAALVRCCSKQC